MNKQQLIKQITNKVVATNPSEYVEQTGEGEYSLERPFDLEDILKAWSNQKGNSTLDYVLTLWGDYVSFERQRNSGSYDCYWRLGLSTHLQDEYTLRFINDILQ